MTESANPDPLGFGNDWGRALDHVAQELGTAALLARRTFRTTIAAAHVVLAYDHLIPHGQRQHEYEKRGLNPRTVRRLKALGREYPDVNALPDITQTEALRRLSAPRTQEVDKTDKLSVLDPPDDDGPPIDVYDAAEGEAGDADDEPAYAERLAAAEAEVRAGLDEPKPETVAQPEGPPAEILPPRKGSNAWYAEQYDVAVADRAAMHREVLDLTSELDDVKRENTFLIQQLDPGQKQTHTEYNNQVARAKHANHGKWQIQQDKNEMAREVTRLRQALKAKEKELWDERGADKDPRVQALMRRNAELEAAIKKYRQQLGRP